MLKKSSGFIMADSMLALMIISLGIISLVICQSQLNRQQEQHLARLTAARLAKEASDAYLVEQSPAMIKRDGYRAVATPAQVVVTRHGQVILRVAK